MSNKIVVVALGCILTFGIYGSLIGQNLILDKRKMSVQGTSTLHDWESSINEITVSGEVILDRESLEAVNNIQVSIPARSIKSTKGNLMDKKTHQALKASKHPSITFKMKDADIDEKTSTVTMNGTLTIAGKSKDVPLKLTYKVLSDQQVSFQTSHEINLKDFNIEPPTAMMGTIKTGKKVNLSFALVVNVAKNAVDISKSR